MTEHHQVNSTARERELELEVARLQAELDTLRGEDPSAATSRFLAMAAETVDKAVEDARREADEIVVEISAQAEARRDEATRVAAEAEAMAEQLLAEADRAQESVAEATEEAAAIKASAEEEAAAIVSAGRGKLAAEAEAFAEVRAALDEERVALEGYHEALRRQVQDLATSMVSFMNTELPGDTAGALGGLVIPELEAVAATPTDRAEIEEIDVEGNDESELDATDDAHTEDAHTDDAIDSEGLDTDDELDATDDTHTEDELDTEVSDNAALGTDVVETDTTDASDEVDAGTDTSDPLDTPAPVAAAPAAATNDPWVEMLESAIPEEDRIVDMPDSAIDEIPPGPPSMFAGVPVIEDSVGDEPVAEDAETGGAKRFGGSLFARVRGAQDSTTGFEDLADDGDDESDLADDRTTGLFGTIGARLVEQTPPEDLADALDEDDTDDEAFRQFLDGDDAPDPSRDWLLRPEQS